MKDALYVISRRNAGKYEALARRAEQSHDDELADFFRAVRDDNRRRTEEARRLLARRVAE